MKERIEFVDGSYYEFDRASEDLVAEMRNGAASLGWYTRVADRTDGVYSGFVNKSLPYLYFLTVCPNEKDFSLALSAKNNTKADFSPNAVNSISEAVIAIGLVQQNDCADLIGFGPGLYIPVFYNANVLGSLLSDLSLVTSKVIYEPKLITERTKRTLNSTNHYD